MQAAIALALIVLALAGCGSHGVIVDTQVVKVPVAQACEVDAPGRRSYATEFLTPDSNDFEKIRALLVERRQRMGVEEELRMLLDACTEPLSE